MDAIEAGETILRCIDHILKEYPENYDRIGELEKQLTDTYHVIEFTPFDVQRGFKFAKQVQDIRRERRELKDSNELLKPLHDFLSASSSTAFKNGLVNAINKTKQRERDLSSRFYKPRSQEFKQKLSDHEIAKEV